MTKIAKKSRVVKGQKGAKPSPPRYVIRKDSLGRRYATDKRNGKRVPVAKAKKEQDKRKKAAAKTVQVFRGIIPQRRQKPQTVKKRRSEAAKRGWETRRAKAVHLPPLAPPSFAEMIGPLIPKGVAMHVVGGIADRAEAYPKVGEAAYEAWLVQQLGKIRLKKAIELKLKPPDVITPRFDRIYGKGHGAFVLNNFYYRASDLEHIDQMVETLDELPNNDYDRRELYTLYFSPEAI